MTVVTSGASAAAAYGGALSGEFAVDTDGGAGYRIAIEVPPGTAGLQPSLSLMYNSAAGNGLLGVGWSVVGLSAITRVAQTMAQDGASLPVEYGPTDRFALDGQRLVSVDGTSYADADAVFQSELQTWTRVTAVPGEDGPARFVAVARDGTTREYGGVPESAVPATSGRAVIRMWALNNVIDRHGNSMAVSYELDADNAMTYPTRIDYTANGAGDLEPSRAVTFDYEERPDPVVRYQGGYAVRIIRRMTAIRTWVDGALVRSYEIAYQPTNASTGRSRVATVTMADAGGAELGPTVVSWQDRGPGIFTGTATRTTAPGVPLGVLLPMDVNGDGRIDLVNAYANNGHLQLALFLSNGSGFSSRTLDPTAVPFSPSMWLLPMDVNGDGCIDLVCGVNDSELLGVTVFLSRPDGEGGWLLVPGPVNKGAAGDTQWSDSGRLLPMDVDGDGCCDLVWAYGKAYQLALRVLFSNGSSFAPAESDRTSPSLPWSPSAQVVALDFNGDGMTDLAYGYPDAHGLTVRLFVSRGDAGLEQEPADPNLTDGRLPEAAVLMALDVNGDGLDDLVVAHLAGASLSISTVVSNGLAFEPPVPQTFTLPAPVPLQPPVLMPMEVNGDGLADLVLARASGECLVLDVLLSTGDGFASATSPTPPPTTVPTSSTALPVDFQGDGRTGLVFCFADGDNLTLAAMGVAGPYPDLATNLVNALGGGFAVAYRPLTDPSVYTKGPPALTAQVEPSSLVSNRISGATWALSATGGRRGSAGAEPTSRRTQFPKYVTARYEKIDGRGGSYGYSYYYTGALLDLTGRGWLGFATIELTDEMMGTTMVAERLQQFPLTGYMQTVTLARAVDGGLMRRTATTYHDVEGGPASGPGVFLVLTDSIRTDWFTFAAPDPTPQPDETELRSYQHDEYGQVLTTAVEGSAVGAALYTTCLYENNPEVWQIGTLTERTVCADPSGDGVLTRQVFDVDWVAGDVNAVQTWDDQRAEMLVTWFGYDVFGNQTTVTDPSGATTRIRYDAAVQTYVASKTAPATGPDPPLHWFYEYDPRFGLSQRRTDPNGQAHTQRFDALGRVIATGGPDPTGATVELTTLEWGADAAGVYLEQQILTAWSGDHRWLRHYVDGLGRSYRWAWLGPDGSSTVVVERTFGSRNEVLTESLPHLDGTEAPKSTRVYDPFGRLLVLETPTPTGQLATRFDYPRTNKVVRTDGAGLESARVSTFDYARFDAGRLVIAMSDPSGGCTTLTYDGLGRVTTATDPLGVTATTTYDSLGRRTAFSIASADCVQSSLAIAYDDPGRTVTQRDESGTVITHGHDPLGRLIRSTVQQVSAEQQTTTYVLDDPDHAYGLARVCKVMLPDGGGYSYEYDAAGNQILTVVEVAREKFEFSKRFTPDRRLSDLVFPDGSAQGNHFNAAGALIEVTFAPPGADPPVSVIHYDAFSELGAPLQGGHGDGSDFGFDFDTVGRLERKAATAADGTPLIESVYLWNDLGELSDVQDRVQPQYSQHFDYDPCGRLKTATGPYGPLGFDYDPGGNLISKDAVTYECVGHQVRSGFADGVEVFAADYDANGNLTHATRGSVRASYTYNGEGRLVAAGNASMRYDHVGRRLLKQVEGGNTTYYVSPHYELTQAPDGGRQHSVYLYAPDGIVAVWTTVDAGSGVGSVGLPTPGLAYVITDHRGSVEVMSSTQTADTTTVRYKPFGEAALDGTDQVPRRFAGKPWDPDLGLLYFESRFYDPTIGRFLTPDDRVGAPYTRPGALNRYAFATNDPINLVDPSGHDVEHFFSHDLPAFFDQKAVEYTVSTVVDLALVAVGGALAFGTLGAGPTAGVLGSVALGMGISGVMYEITTGMHGGHFDWREWGTNLGIGGLTGLIGGVISVGATAGVEAAAASGRAAFYVGGLGRFAVDAVTGILSGGASAVGGRAVGNVAAHQRWTEGLGSATLFGGALGGATGLFGDLVAAGLARDVRQAPDLCWRDDGTAVEANAGEARTMQNAYARMSDDEQEALLVAYRRSRGSPVSQRPPGRVNLPFPPRAREGLLAGLLTVGPTVPWMILDDVLEAMNHHPRW